MFNLKFIKNISFRTFFWSSYGNLSSSKSINIYVPINHFLSSYNANNYSPNLIGCSVAGVIFLFKASSTLLCSIMVSTSAWRKFIYSIVSLFIEWNFVQYRTSFIYVKHYSRWKYSIFSILSFIALIRNCITYFLGAVFLACEKILNILLRG